MSENKTLVYVVTSGEYSSYSIEGVFTDKVLAEKLVDKLNEAYKDLRERARIEEFYLNLPVEEFEVTRLKEIDKGEGAKPGAGDGHR